MNILHVASFNGNIGDHGNHAGFRLSMRNYFGDELHFENLEIRNFYRSWGLNTFDEEFAKYANQFDLVVFGGGNFCEMCWDYSATGTTLDISNKILDCITAPILFNGMGVDDKDGTVNRENIHKFGKFLDQLIQKESLITVRNDGSMEILKKYYENSLTEKVRKIPDGGFFIQPADFFHVEIPDGKRIISINLAGDAENIRFSLNGKDGRITKEQFIKECAECINLILENYEDIHIVMAPHINKDLDIIQSTLAQVKDYYVRTKISVAPCLNGDSTNGDYIFDLYRKSDLVVGMRYHANVCAIAVNTPTIGIVNFTKHKKMYEDIQMTDRVVASDETKFSERLYQKIGHSLSNLPQMKLENEILLKRLSCENRNYLEKLIELVEKHK